jgi:hypothetical protein
MKRVGKWTTTYKFWMGGPGSEAMTSTGTAEMKSILGGRWLQEICKGVIMGQPHEAIGLSGYNLRLGDDAKVMEIVYKWVK